MNAMRGSWRAATAAGTIRMVAMLVVFGGALAGVRSMAPAMLTIAEILLGIGQACVTFLRGGGF